MSLVRIRLPDDVEARGDDEALEAANEALATDNEALAIGESVHEPHPPYRALKKRTAKNKAKR